MISRVIGIVTELFAGSVTDTSVHNAFVAVIGAGGTCAVEAAGGEEARRKGTQKFVFIIICRRHISRGGEKSEIYALIFKSVKIETAIGTKVAIRPLPFFIWRILIPSPFPPQRRISSTEKSWLRCPVFSNPFINKMYILLLDTFAMIIMWQQRHFPCYLILLYNCPGQQVKAI